MEHRIIKPDDIHRSAETSQRSNPNQDILRRMVTERENGGQHSPERNLALSDRVHAFNSAHEPLRAGFQTVKQADIKLQKTLETHFTDRGEGEIDLGDWSKLYVDSQALLKQVGSFSSPTGNQARDSLRREVDALSPVWGQLDSKTQCAFQEATDALYAFEKSQDITQYAQTHFTRSADAIRPTLYTETIKPGEEFESFVPPFIKKYTDSDHRRFYRHLSRINPEQAKNGEAKLVGISYYNPSDRFFITYSTSREDQAKLLKPLYGGETEKEIYQRTITHSEDIYHVQEVTTRAHNETNAVKVSLQDMPDLTVVQHTLANNVYRDVRPELNLSDSQKDYSPQDPEFRLLMGKVPNFKAVDYLLSQHYPHLEVQHITIFPNETADAAMIYAATRQTQARD